MVDGVGVQGGVRVALGGGGSERGGRRDRREVGVRAAFLSSKWID